MDNEDKDPDDTKKSKVAKNLARAVQLRKKANQLTVDLTLLAKWQKNEGDDGPVGELTELLEKTQAGLTAAAILYEGLPATVMTRRRASRVEFETGMVVRPKPSKLAEFSSLFSDEQVDRMEVTAVKAGYVRLKTESGTQLFAQSSDLELRPEA